MPRKSGNVASESLRTLRTLLSPKESAILRNERSVATDALPELTELSSPKVSDAAEDEGRGKRRRACAQLPKRRPYESIFVRIRGPFAVIATVCSKCADHFASAETIVHLSLNVRIAAVPMLTIGSIASVIPAISFVPRFGLPKFGT